MKNSFNAPTISVVMSVYNGQDYVEDAIKSILVQTYENFEFIIIDDGSQDDTLKKIKAFRDKRIKLIARKNKGLVYSLNEGIKLARGKYIARQDADDISEPTRFEKQIRCFESNPRLVLVGSSIKVIDESGHYKRDHLVLTDDPEIREELGIRSPFAHGSTMYKKQDAINVGLYKNTQWPAEDYGLWVRLASKGMLANVDEPLYQYRENIDGISLSNSKKQNAKKEVIARQARVRNISKTYDHKVLRNIFSKYALNTTPAGDARLQRYVENVLSARQRGGIKAYLRTLASVLSSSSPYKLIGRKMLRKLGIE